MKLNLYAGWNCNLCNLLAHNENLPRRTGRLLQRCHTALGCFGHSDSEQHPGYTEVADFLLADSGLACYLC